MAKTPEDSEHTSIRERIAPQFDLADAVKEQVDLQALLKFDLPIKELAQFEGRVTSEQQSGILFSLNDYLELVDFTGRCIRSGKRGAIPINLPPILQRLNFNHETWLTNATQFEKDYNAKFSRRCRKRSKPAYSPAPNPLFLIKPKPLSKPPIAGKPDFGARGCVAKALSH